MHDNWKQTIELLLARVCLQDQASFENLYQITSPKLYGLILKIVSDPDAAADALQESYSKIWHQASRYRSDLGENWAWAWICQIARNSAIDQVRRAGHRYEQPLDEATISSFTDESKQLSEQRDLNYCLSQLKTEPRKVIVLAYIHGFSHSELAHKLKTPIGTLKSWIRRGLKELEICLNN
jgi:RNA polymerase sigma-70 factor (ECF subfamily)